jgi:hypothetical protein
MTALMVLFLVAVSVALFSITQKVISGPDKHGKMVEVCMAEVSEMTQKEFLGLRFKVTQSVLERWLCLEQTSIDSM